MIERNRLVIDNWSSRLYEAVLALVSVGMGVNYLVWPNAFSVKAYIVLAGWGDVATDAFTWCRLATGVFCLYAAVMATASTRLAASVVHLGVLGFLASVFLASYHREVYPAPGPAIVYFALSLGLIAAIGWLSCLMYLQRRGLYE